MAGATLRRAEIECAHMEIGGVIDNSLRDAYSLEAELRAVWRCLARLAERSTTLDVQAPQPNASFQVGAHHGAGLEEKEEKAVDMAEEVEPRGLKRRLSEVDVAISELREAMSSARAEHTRESIDFTKALKDVREQVKTLDSMTQELADNVVSTAQETTMLLQALAVEAVTPQVTPMNGLRRSVSAPACGEAPALASDGPAFGPATPRKPGRLRPPQLRISTDVLIPTSPSRSPSRRGNNEGGFGADPSSSQEMLGVRENLMQIRKNLLEQQQQFGFAEVAPITPTGGVTTGVREPHLSLAIPRDAEPGSPKLQSIPEAVSPEAVS